MSYNRHGIDMQAMREDAEEQAAFNRRSGYKGKKNPYDDYNNARQDEQDLIDEAKYD